MEGKKKLAIYRVFRASFPLLLIGIAAVFININPQRNSHNLTANENVTGFTLTDTEKANEFIGREYDFVVNETLADSTIHQKEPVELSDYDISLVSDSPVGRVYEVSIQKLFDNLYIDLTGYDYNYIVFKWSKGDFDWAVSDSLDEFKYRKVENSHDPSVDGDYVSELYETDKAKYVSFSRVDPVENFRIHLIDTTEQEESNTYKASNDSSGFNSGVKYSTLNIISREQWSNYSNINDPRLSSEGGRLTWDPVYYEAKKFVIHHTYPNENNYSDPAEQVRGIYSYHSVSRGWGDIGYNYLIDWRGNIYEGKLGGEEAKGYHASSGNANSIGIAMIGTFTDESITREARSALVKLIAEKSAIYSITPSWQSTVYGHRNFQATACPGQELYDDLSGITTTAANYKASHFAGIKSVVSEVEDIMGVGTYKTGKLMLEFNTAQSVSSLSKFIPFESGSPVDWTGISDYEIDGKTVYLYINYSADGDLQGTDKRLETLFKLLWLSGEARVVGVNGEYKGGGGHS